MASAQPATPPARGVAPWFLLAGGIILCCAAVLCFFVAVRSQRLELTGISHTLPWVGLLLMALALHGQVYRSHRPAPVADTNLTGDRIVSIAQPKRTSTGLLTAGIAISGLVFILHILFFSMLWYYSWKGSDRIPWGVGLATLIWLMFVPLYAMALGQAFFQVLRPIEHSHAWETCTMLCLISVGCFAGGWALGDWHSMWMVWGILHLIPSVAAALWVVPQGFRRAVLSFLIVYHFAGIMTAALSAPPSPWIVGQIWVRIYRPYLEFMYLNNAYHFYAPEPGPASYLWFWVTYDTGEKTEVKDGQGDNVGFPITKSAWVKIPDLDAQGRHRYLSGLVYQRMLSLTENVLPTQQPPPPLFTAAGPTPVFQWRYRNTPIGAKMTPAIGVKLPDVQLEIPFHSSVPVESQYRFPSRDSLLLIRSFCKHVAQQPHPEHPEWKAISAKMYRVTHWYMPTESIREAIFDPQDPESYHPYFLGEYDATGNLKDPNDPFLYWLLPVVREGWGPEAVIMNYAYYHAGDPEWKKPAAK